MTVPCVTRADTVFPRCEEPVLAVTYDPARARHVVEFADGRTVALTDAQARLLAHDTVAAERWLATYEEATR